MMLEDVRYGEKASLQEGEALLLGVVPQQPRQRFRQLYLSPVTRHGFQDITQQLSIKFFSFSRQDVQDGGLLYDTQIVTSIASLLSI
jgi:hypothetical protein